ncbi:MAG: two-component system, sensor histidine kinase and response regulator [Methyloprofundus sp.]|nr:MAG: two-component system, sensor histidine kinase and response regulator [Methyloprofundus sp.]
MNDFLNSGMQWTDKLSVGIDEIDADHKVMFQLFHEAYLLSQTNPDAGQLCCFAVELIDYAEAHFRREEAIMSASAYPFCKNHFAIHEQLLKQARQQCVLVTSGQQTVVDFVIFLRNWLCDHILGTDQRMAAYVEGHELAIEEALQEVEPLALPEYTHIYLVDDDENYVELMQAMTEAANLKSIAYTSGDEFLSASITEDDLVVLDLNMPGKDGIEVMRELADKNVRPTFILVSGFDERVLHSAKQLAEAKHLVVAEILSKPIDTEVFIEVLIRVYIECKLARTKKEIKQNHAIKIAPDGISVDELRQALQQHEFIIYVQPQVNFSNRQVTGVEVLVRWQHPDRGLVFPDQFIPLAEEHQLMSELTDAVILEAIKAYQQFKVADISITVAINLSAQNINDLELPEKLGALLTSHGIRPEAFMLELTESAVLSDTSAALDILNRLRMKGFSLSIDDFGTGESSLIKLYQSPFSELKIDQHFVMRIANDKDADAIVRICILLAKELKMQTVAEGIETQVIWDKLKALGCDVAQGYFIAKPMPVDGFVEWFHSWEMVGSKGI